MMTEYNHIPEVAAFGRQVFLERMPPPIAFSDLPRALPFNPLQLDRVLAFPVGGREFLLGAQEAMVVCTAHMLEPAFAVQQLFRRALMQINTAVDEARIQVNRVAAARSIDDLRGIKPVNGGGMIIAGITGVSKTHTVKRMLQLISPEPVLRYEHGAVPGAYAVTQVPYLYVDFPSNGSRGGLMKRILLALDDKLGTNYNQEHEKSVNLDTLLVIATKLMSFHRLALLVIDEKQGQTFGESAYSLEFVLFYLSLMNLGISVVLIGNPHAYDCLAPFSQVLRRFSTGGLHTMRPATASDAWWKRDLATGAANFDLVEGWDVSIAERAEIGMKSCGGIPGLYMALQAEVQRVALRRGVGRARVTVDDYQTAEESPRYILLKGIADAVNGGGERTNQFVDLPLDDEDGAPPKDGLGNVQPLGLTGEKGDYVRRALTQFKAKQTRDANRLAEQIKSIQSMKPEDLRLLGITEELIEGLRKSAGMETPPKRRSKPKK